MDSNFAVLIWQIQEELEKLSDGRSSDEFRKVRDLLEELETKIQLLPCVGDGL